MNKKPLDKLSKEDSAWLFSKVLLLHIINYGSIFVIVSNAIILGTTIVAETKMPSYGWVVGLCAYFMGLHTRRWLVDGFIVVAFSGDDLKNITKKADGE